MAALAAASLGLAAAPVAPPGADAVLAGLQRWLDGTRDLRGRFEQSLVSGALGAGIEESGRLLVRRPGRMRWDYAKPEVKVALVDGDRTRLYIEADRQLWEGSLDEAGGLLPALLARQAPLGEWFEPSLVATPENEARDAIRLRLVPRKEQAAFGEVVLTLDRSAFGIRSAEVLDGAGNRILYRFRGLERNQGVPESAFHFEPPPGTEVVVRSP